MSAVAVALLDVSSVSISSTRFGPSAPTAITESGSAATAVARRRRARRSGSMMEVDRGGARGAADLSDRILSA